MKSLYNNGFFLACLSGALYGTLGLFGIHLMREGLSIAEMSWLRFVLATAVTFSVLQFKKQPLIWNRHAWVVLVSSGIFYSIATYSYFLSIEMIGSGLAMVLFFLYPLPVALFEWMFDKKKHSQALYITFALISVSLFFLSDFSCDLKNIEGILFGLLSAVLFAIYFYVTEKHVKKIGLWEGTFFICLGNLIGFGLSVIITGGRFFPHLNSHIVLDICLIAFLTTIFPIYLVYRSMRYIGPSIASILSVFEPVVTLILGVLFLHEYFTFYQMTGVITILSSVLFLHWQEQKNKIKS